MGTGRLLFSYQLLIYNPKLWFVYCLSSHLTAHKPEHKSWGKAMTASGNWKIKPKKRSLQCPNDENSWAGLEINRLKAAYPKILVCISTKQHFPGGADRNHDRVCLRLSLEFSAMGRSSCLTSGSGAMEMWFSLWFHSKCGNHITCMEKMIQETIKRFKTESRRNLLVPDKAGEHILFYRRSKWNTKKPCYSLNTADE